MLIAPEAVLQHVATCRSGIGAGTAFWIVERFIPCVKFLKTSSTPLAFLVPLVDSIGARILVTRSVFVCTLLVPFSLSFFLRLMARDTQANKRTRDDESAVKLPALPPPGADATETAEIDDSQDHNLNLSSDIKGILVALQQVREKAVSDGQKKIEEILKNMTGEIKALVEETKKLVEKDRQALANASSKACKEYEKTMKEEADKYKKAYEAFCNVKDMHLQTYDDIFSKFEDTKENILIKCDQQRKKEKVVLSDLQRICAEKIGAAERSVRKRKQDEKSFNLLKKSLGCIFDSDGSNEDVED